MREKRKNAARHTGRSVKRSNTGIHNNNGNMRVNLGACLL